MRPMISLMLAGFLCSPAMAQAVLSVGGGGTMPSGGAGTIITYGGSSTLTTIAAERGEGSTIAAAPVITTWVGSGGITSTSFTTTLTFLNSASAAGGVIIGPMPRPGLSLDCNDDACTVRAANMDQARDWLERIANRGTRIDIVVDQNCHPQRESIPPRGAEVATLEAR